MLFFISSLQLKLFGSDSVLLKLTTSLFQIGLQCAIFVACLVEGMSIFKDSVLFALTLDCSMSLCYFRRVEMPIEFTFRKEVQRTEETKIEREREGETEKDR